MSESKKHAVVSYGSSAVLHTGLISMVVWSAMPVWTESGVSEPVLQTTVADQSSEPVVEDPDRQDKTVDDQHASPERESADRTVVESTPSVDSPGLADFSRRRLEQARQSASKKSSDEQLSELESLGRRLEQVSSAESAAEVAGTISSWLGGHQRATEPNSDSSPSGAAFDVKTAQISKVDRVETNDGVSYVATLIDAKGNTSEIVLDAADGPTLYETFQLMKRFPLLKSVYQGAVMGILDKLAESEKEMEEAPADSQALEPNQFPR